MVVDFEPLDASMELAQAFAAYLTAAAAAIHALPVEAGALPTRMHPDRPHRPPACTPGGEMVWMAWTGPHNATLQRSHPVEKDTAALQNASSLPPSRAALQARRGRSSG